MVEEKGTMFGNLFKNLIVESFYFLKELVMNLPYNYINIFRMSGFVFRQLFDSTSSTYTYIIG